MLEYNETASYVHVFLDQNVMSCFVSVFSAEADEGFVSWSMLKAQLDQRRAASRSPRKASTPTGLSIPDLLAPAGLYPALSPPGLVQLKAHILSNSNLMEVPVMPVYRQSVSSGTYVDLLGSLRSIDLSSVVVAPSGTVSDLDEVVSVSSDPDQYYFTAEADTFSMSDYSDCSSMSDDYHQSYSVSDLQGACEGSEDEAYLQQISPLTPTPQPTGTKVFFGFINPWECNPAAELPFLDSSMELDFSGLKLRLEEVEQMY